MFSQGSEELLVGDQCEVDLPTRWAAVDLQVWNLNKMQAIIVLHFHCVRDSDSHDLIGVAIDAMARVGSNLASRFHLRSFLRHRECSQSQLRGLLVFDPVPFRCRCAFQPRPTESRNENGIGLDISLGLRTPDRFFRPLQDAHTSNVAMPFGDNAGRFFASQSLGTRFQITNPSQFHSPSASRNNAIVAGSERGAILSLIEC